MKVQDPDNSSQTVYDSWVKSNITSLVSCKMVYIRNRIVIVVIPISKLLDIFSCKIFISKKNNFNVIADHLPPHKRLDG